MNRWRCVCLLVFAMLPTWALESTETLSPAAASSVSRAVGWLGRTQNANGTWPGHQGNTAGIVAAGAIALMSQGNLPGVGQYGVACARALNFLLGCAQTNGLIYRQDMGPSPMYHHGLATLALAEAWGQSADPRFRDVLTRAVQLICSTQNRQGGWRYQPIIADADLSVTVMQLMALRAAKDAGIDVSGEVIRLGIEYVKSCHNAKSQGKDGGFAYMPGGQSGFPRTGAGVTSLLVAGDDRADEVSEGITYLLANEPFTDKKAEHFFYGVYYATMGIYQAQSLGAVGRGWWNRWYPLVVRDLLSRQEADGSFGPAGDRQGYNTAMGVLILTIPYRYLPVYQR